MSSGFDAYLVRFNRRVGAQGQLETPFGDAVREAIVTGRELPHYKEWTFAVEVQDGYLLGRVGFEQEEAYERADYDEMSQEWSNVVDTVETGNFLHFAIMLDESERYAVLLLPPHQRHKADIRLDQAINVFDRAVRPYGYEVDKVPLPGAFGAWLRTVPGLRAIWISFKPPNPDDDRARQFRQRYIDDINAKSGMLQAWGTHQRPLQIIDTEVEELAEYVDSGNGSVAAQSVPDANGQADTYKTDAHLIHDEVVLPDEDEPAKATVIATLVELARRAAQFRRRDDDAPTTT